MKILHTSDWHLGRTLCGKRRTREFEAFLEWLLSVLEKYRVDVLIVAGDVFDSTVPSPVYQQLYYRFLCRAAGGRHAVVVGGNHDSPSFLDAPKDILRSLNVHVVGAVPENMQDELLTIRSVDGKPELLICAVPYLRDRDIRSLELGAESLQDKDRKILEGIGRHYGKAGHLAKSASASLGGVPVVGTGHLFASGGETTEGDGVRDLYIGSLLRVGADLFPSCFDYVALGHLHSPQKVGGLEHIRYCGSPFPMSAREAAIGNKCVLLVEFTEEGKPSVTELQVPMFQKFAYISGGMETLSREITELRLMSEEVWTEVSYEGKRIPGLRDKVMELAADSMVEILKIRDASAEKNAMNPEGLDFSGEGVQDIGELDESDVFLQCMEKRNVPEEDRSELMDTYRRVLASIYEESAEN